ncbi:hypothetical protein [Micromonospora sp. NBC_00858]|uniref:hypothetical protein n=1 Tax=Micromonospora sp. NBC_00858 TaxID=2975979 RepID=UPI0038643281|nr:hypothetical protein OG990_05295 [Micromonospora sp. NBC_00858]
MQFLAQIRLADAEVGSAGLLSVFMCQNEPGFCDEWDAAAGGNKAFIFGSDATPVASLPDEGVTMLDETSAIRFLQVEGDDYLEARDRWSGETGRSVPCPAR